MESKHHKIKILFSIPNFDTAGSGKALLKVAMGLNTNRFEPHIMCLHGKGAFFKVVKESGIPVHTVKYTTPMKPYWKGLRNCYKISRLLKSINPTIIHSFHYGADYSEPLAAKIAGLKWVYTKKNMNWGGASKNGWRIRSYLANGIVAQNTDMLQLFFSKFKKTHLIPRGVDTMEFKPMPSNSELKEQWNITEEQRILICVANLVPVKGIEVLINAFAHIADTHKDWLLFIVGDYNSEYGFELMELVVTLGLKERIVFTGKQENINEYLSLTEIFVLPTLNEGRKEGSPVALLEAMACEKNILGSNISGIKDQLHDFPNHLVEAGNVFALQKSLSKLLLNSTEENKQKGMRFRKHVLENFSLEKEVARCEQLYLQLV